MAWEWFDAHVMRPETTGLIGSALGVVNAPGAGWRERLFNFGSGLGAAWFLAPAIEDYFELSSRNQRMAVAFVIGLVGMNLVAKVIEHVKKTPLFALLSARGYPKSAKKREPKQ
jgi:hypothetical protein